MMFLILLATYFNTINSVTTPPVNGPIPIYTNPPQLPQQTAPPVWLPGQLPGPYPYYYHNPQFQPQYPVPYTPSTTINTPFPPATSITPITPVIPVGPGTPIEVICVDSEPCACPIGHIGECLITCDGVSNPDVCKDALIECNNDGFPCIVNCISQNSCSGSASIFGPANSALTVNCMGTKSCEGALQINAELGTDTSVLCDGTTSCKGTQFNFGAGINKVECNGSPDACKSSIWNLLPNARVTAGTAFECKGNTCPSNVPEPFNNAGM
eukprot:324436_1